MSDRIESRKQGRFGRIWLRAGALNILNREDLDELAHAIADLENCAVVLLEARGERAFCAGVDVADHLPDRAPAMLETFHATARAFRNAAPLIVCAVNGPALGGGFELVLLSDLAVCSTRATFSLPEVELAALPPVACALLPRLVGERRALELIVGGQRLDAAAARDWGLVCDVVEPGALAERAEALCTRLLSYSGDALRACKRATRACDLESAMRTYRDELLPTADAAEGIAAFLEKRPPLWAHTRHTMETSI
ncbi:MAG: enoyl-CoA hydratase/isomerase family protein [Vulcanimicrobiaceae bacterium]